MEKVEKGGVRVFFWRRHKRSKNWAKQTSPVSGRVFGTFTDKKISGDLEETIAFLQKWLGKSDDFNVRRFRIFGRFPAALINFSKLVDETLVNEDIFRSLMTVPRHLQQNLSKRELKDVLVHETLHYLGISVEHNIATIVEEVLRGKTLIVADGMHAAILINTRDVKKRSVTEPETERVIRGSREGFIENLESNLGLIRYRLPTVDFRVKVRKIGRVTKTKIALCFLENIVNPKLIEEIDRRMSAIDIDGVLDSGAVEQFIEDHHTSPFPQIQNTERPDKTVAALLEGRAAIFVDGSPFALIVPAMFNQFYQTVEDYTERFVIGSLVRLIRLLAIVFALTLSALYVALTSFNPELIPTDFAVAVAGGRSGVPYPPVIEVLMIETVMEVLREATIRMPQQVGGAISIVGVLVIGNAAVAAGLANPITIVIVALTTIGSFATPAYNMAIAFRMLRFPMIILAGLFGLYGIMIGIIFIVNHMVSLRSFGVPYLSPLATSDWQGLKDTLIRGPLWAMRQRPVMLHPLNNKRVGERVERLKKAPSNTLDPHQVGNERAEMTDGEPTPDHSDSNNGDHH